ncbi:MAG: endonuclease/exonuclease/phosphatase family protein [Actinobacteria bacterium]|uniref:Endonuclease/exonuclease/phosphatase family protein n=1 Tax=Nostocoides veronense TaxID=330836 RepID=A0ABP4XTR5_9MICO|nr:endonuclease/exonuclease/phosphatase family protein [Actinomycetota bacterium]
MSTLRVATYNTRDFLDDRRAAARVIRAIDPDVLCLQEVPRRLFAARRVAAFARLCDMTWAGHHRGSGGTTIFTSSRVEVVESRHFRLRVALAQRTRGFAVTRVALPGREPLVVASVHLSLKAQERTRHMQQILAAVGTRETIVCGDLNEQSDGAAWKLLATPLRLISPGAPTFPAKAPRRLLDVIFAAPSVTALPHNDIRLDPDDVVAASDHRPVWVDIRTDPDPANPVI